MTDIPLDDPGLTSIAVQVTVAVQFTGGNWDMVNVTGAIWSRTREGIVEVRSQNGSWFSLSVGSWVIQYGPGDYGILSDGAMERFFPLLRQRLRA